MSLESLDRPMSAQGLVSGGERQENSSQNMSKTWVAIVALK